jgi:hypothetical protein
MADEMIAMAVEQLLPSALDGMLITMVIVVCAPTSMWMLPGLWQIIFSLGVFASCRFLPRPMLAAGIWYWLTGLVSIGLGDRRAFSPWVMGLSFGIAQFLVAAMLMFTREEPADESQTFIERRPLCL